MARSGKGTGQRSQLRIIGGKWRGRKFSFNPAQGLRPTTDRVRETLFNWLSPYIQGARCADLFAGSGALGLEALSRGAVHCDFVDSSTTAIAQINHHLVTVDAVSSADCHAIPAERYLGNTSRKYDILFIDPPFGLNLVEPCCNLLAQQQLLASEALVYIETASREPHPDLPSGWSLHREKTAGGVAYRLFVVTGE